MALLSNLISTSALEAELGSRHLLVMDATWHLPVAGKKVRDAHAEYREAHIPCAVFADIDEISDQETALPHMLPSPEQFQTQMRELGVSDASEVVVYDSLGLFSAARMWWMLKAFGHQRVSLLDGGLPRWREEGRPLEQGASQPSKGNFEAHLQPNMVCSLAKVRDAKLVLDARSAPRFRGEAPEPRPGISSGHMPNAKNLPFDRLIEHHGLRPASELREVFDELGVREGMQVVTSCGSGVTAAIISLALAEVGHKDHALYDGSWAEYASRCPSGIVVGE